MVCCRAAGVFQVADVVMSMQAFHEAFVGSLLV